MKRLNEGDRVTLKADEDEGWPEQTGTFLGVSGSALMVELDPEHREDDRDDGLREVTFDQIL